MVRLVPITPEESHAFLERSDRQYADEHVRVGNREIAGALALARTETSRLLPQGLDTPVQSLRSIRDDAWGVRVGEGWYSLQRSERRPLLSVYWVGIDGPYRRRGFATRLRRLEGESQRLGTARIALSVFAENTSTFALYAKLGYAPTRTMMAKTLRS